MFRCQSGRLVSSYYFAFICTYLGIYVAPFKNLFSLCLFNLVMLNYETVAYVLDVGEVLIF